MESLHLTPVMFELGARPHAPQDLYRSYLEQSHIFVLEGLGHTSRRPPARPPTPHDSSARPRTCGRSWARPGLRKVEPYEKHVARARASLDPETFETVWKEGRAMTIEQALEFALSE